MTTEYFAHSLPGRPKEEWQRLEDHLKNVAELARGFGEEFGVGSGDIWRGFGMIWEILAFILGKALFHQRRER